MTTVRGKTAIVTGGANGIGFQCCRQLLHDGAKAVAILDLPNSIGEESTKKLIEKFGEGRAFFFPSDVAKFDEFADVFKKASSALQGVDILINNAGIFDERNWQKMVDVNFSAVVNSTLTGYDFMGKHKGGTGGIIVNVSSVAGLVPSPFLPIYSGTKHAVVGFTTSMKNCYEKTGISLRVICPGLTDTAITIWGNHLPIVESAAATTNFKSIPKQSAECVARALIEIIEKGENGSVWVSRHSNQPYEVDIYEATRMFIKD